MLPYYGSRRAGDTKPETVYEYVFEAIRHGIGNTLSTVYDIANHLGWDATASSGAAAQRLRRLLSHIAKFSSSSAVISRMVDSVNFWQGVLQHIYPVILGYDPFPTMSGATVTSHGSLPGSLAFVLPANRVFHVRIHHELTRVLDPRYMTTTQGFSTNYKHAIEGFVPDATLATCGVFTKTVPGYGDHTVRPYIHLPTSLSASPLMMDDQYGFFDASHTAIGPASITTVSDPIAFYDSPNVTKNPASLILSASQIPPAELDGWVAHSSDPAYGYVTESAAGVPVYTQCYEDELRVSTFTERDSCVFHSDNGSFPAMLFAAGLWDVEGSFLHVAKEAGGTNYNQWAAEIAPNTGTSDAYIHPSVSLVTTYAFTPMGVSSDVDLEIPETDGTGAIRRVRSRHSNRPLIQLGPGVSFDPDYVSTEPDQRVREVGEARQMAMPEVDPHAAAPPPSIPTYSSAMNTRPVSAPFRRK